MSLVTSPSRTITALVSILILVSLSCNLPGMGGGSMEEPTSEVESAQTIVQPPEPLVEEAVIEEPAEPAQAEEQPVNEPAAELENDSAETDVAETGLSLANPHPFGHMVTSPNWDFEVLEVLRGEPAFQRILQDDPDAQQAPPGMEFVIAKVRLRNKFMDEFSHSVGINEVFVVGDGRLTRTDLLWDVPGPELIYTDSYAAEELELWLDALVPQDEGNLILFWDPSSIEEGSRHFLALEEGASLPLPGELAGIAPSDQGIDPTDPVPFGTTAVTDDWQITVLEVLRGDEALNLLLQANDQNQGADEGMDLIMVKVRLSHSGDEDEVQWISNSQLVAAHDGERIYEGPRYYLWHAYDPPWMQIGFLPGGQHEGWMALQAPAGEAGAMLRFQPKDWLGPADESGVRYLSLE